MNARKFFCLTLGIALGLSACGPAVSAPPTDTPAPPATLTAAPPTATIAPPTETLAPTAAPTETESASATETPLSPEAVTVTPTAAPTLGAPIARLGAGQAITLTAINMHNATAGWAIGKAAPEGDDHIFRTADGGQTWKDVTPPQPANAAALYGQGAAAFFLSSARAWATYYDASGAAISTPLVVWQTQDGGISWTASAPLPLPDVADFHQISDLQFIDLQHGWALMHLGVGMSHDYVALYRTIDGGQTWELLSNPSADGGLSMSCGKTGFAFADAKRGWMTGDCMGVVPGGPYFYQTTDGGATWQFVELPAPADMENLFAPDNADYACGATGARFTLPTAGAVLVNCLEFASSTSQAWLYVTADGGQTWAANALPSAHNTYPYVAVPFTFLDGQSGWYMGDGASATEYVLYRTADGGQTWAALKTLAWIGSLDFVDAQTGWAVARAGDAVALVQTTDGGGKWSEIKPVTAP